MNHGLAMTLQHRLVLPLGKVFSLILNPSSDCLIPFIRNNEVRTVEAYVRIERV
jgi:hypothetical protein